MIHSLKERTLAPIAVLLLVGCVGCSGAPPEPPVVADTSQLDPAVVQMFEDSLAAVREDPESGYNWFVLAMGYQATEFFEQAGVAYERSVELDPKLSHAWYQLGRVRKRAGDLKGSVGALRKAAALESYAPIHWRMGEWLLEMGKVEEAGKAYAKAVEIDRRDIAGRVGVARVLLEQGQPEAAVEALNEILELWPQDPEAHLLLGTAFRQLGRDRDAIFHLNYGRGEPIIRNDDWTSELVLYRPGFNDKLQLSNQYLAAGQREIAITMLQYLREEDPNHLRNLTTLALAYRLDGRAEDAAEVLADALERYPENYSVISEWVPVYQILGKHDEALAAAETLIAQQPDKPLSWARKGAVLLGVDRAEDAMDAYKMALERDASDHGVLRSLGDCASKMSRWAEAQDYYGRALELETRDPDLYVRYGFAAYRTESWDTARDAFQRALSLGPTRPENVERLLVEVQQKSGETPLLPGSQGA